MSFLNPLALLGLAAVAVPLALHFFNLRRPQAVDFSSLAFVEEVQEAAAQRVRIREWLLLALRMLAVACLVLAFARPTVTGPLAGLAGAGPSGRTAYGLVVDNSLSMGVDGDRGGPALERAKAHAREGLRAAGDEDEVGVWPVAPEPARTSAPSLEASAEAAQETVADLSPHPGAAPLARTLGRAARAVGEASAPQRVVYAVTDLQRSTLGDSVAAAVPEDVPIYVLPVDTQAPPNVGITDVDVPNRIVEVGQPVQVEATLTNYGPEPLRNYVASVFLRDERVARTTTTLPPGEATTVSFTVTPRTRGWLRGRVQGEGDGFPADDRHHFALNVPEERRVLVVRGSGQETRYVDLALSSEMIADQIAFRTTGIKEEALSTAELGQYDAVLLVGPRTLSGSDVEALARYVDQGGGVLFFPNAEARPADYSALLNAVGGGTVQDFVGTLGADRSVASFGQVDLGHPLFEGVFDRSGSREDAQVEQPEIYHAMRMQPSGGTGQTLIDLSTGAPFLQEVRHGAGTLLVSAVAPSLRWSDLPTRGLFVPLLYRSVYYLSAGASATGAQLVAGRPEEVRVPGVRPDASLRLVGPDGVEVVPEQRTLFGATLLRIDDGLTTPGVYDVMAGDRLVQRLAVNVNPAESDLRVAAPDSVEARLQSVLGAPVEVRSSADPAALAAPPSSRQASTEIWNVFLVLALIFLVSEMLVARQWRPGSAAA